MGTTPPEPNSFAVAALSAAGTVASFVVGFLIRNIAGEYFKAQERREIRREEQNRLLSQRELALEKQALLLQQREKELNLNRQALLAQVQRENNEPVIVSKPVDLNMLAQQVHTLNSQINQIINNEEQTHE